MRNILVDTGAIVGLLNPADRYHAPAERFFGALSPNDRLLTTWPVVTECSFALLRNREALFDWLVLSAMEVVDFGVDDLDAMRHWIKRYPDREIDFADATLVWLAQQRRTNFIATTNFNDFEAYRLPGQPGKKAHFRILLERR